MRVRSGRVFDGARSAPGMFAGVPDRACLRRVPAKIAHRRGCDAIAARFLREPVRVLFACAPSSIDEKEDQR